MFPSLPGFARDFFLCYSDSMKNIKPTIIFFVRGPVPQQDEYEAIAEFEALGLRVRLLNAQWATEDAGIEAADGYEGAVPPHYKKYVEHLEFLASQPVVEPVKSMEYVEVDMNALMNPLDRAISDIPVLDNPSEATLAQAQEILQNVDEAKPVDVADPVVEPAKDEVKEPVVVVKKTTRGKPRKSLEDYQAEIDAKKAE